MMSSKDKQPDFYMTGFARSPENGDDWQKVRACWVRDKIIEKDKTEYLLIKISPSVKCDSWGLEDRDLENLLLLRLHGDTSLDPISDWPFSVYVFGLIDDSVLKELPSVDYIYHGVEPTDFEKEEDIRIRTNLSLQAYCELHKSLDDAERAVGVRPEYPMEVSKIQDVKTAKESFHSIFVSGDFEPFRENIQQKLMIFCDRILDKSHFDAVKKAAVDIGESTAFISLVGDYRAIKKKKVHETASAKYDYPFDENAERILKKSFEERNHYLIDLDFHSYEDLDRRDYPLEYPLSFIEYAIYSTKGTWGILMEEDYALVGGSQEFMDSLKLYIPGIEKEAQEYLGFMRETLSTYANEDIVRLWLPSLIEHVYGSAEAHSMLEESGLNALLS